MDGRRSTSNYCTFVEVNLVTWRIKKQLVVVRLSVEDRFRAMTHEICEILWIRGFMRVGIQFQRSYSVVL